MSIDNLKHTLARADAADYAAGIAAYDKYSQIMLKLATHTGHPHRTACAVFAALSPNSSYHGNLRDAHRCLAAQRDGLSITEFTVSTYGNNKRKAWRIAQGEDPLNLIVANKTRNFFLNVYNPKDTYSVTIDGHMLNAWRGKREPLVGLHFPSKLYEKVADDVRTLAAEQKLLPCRLQGVLWLAWKRQHSILSSRQMEFWDAEMLAARLGFHLNYA